MPSTVRSVRKNGVFHARFNHSVLSRVILSNFATKKRPWVIDARNQQTADGWSEEHRSVKDYLTHGDGIGGDRNGAVDAGDRLAPGLFEGNKKSVALKPPKDVTPGSFPGWRDTEKEAINENTL